MATNTSIRSPWSWIPTLYFAEGMPYVVVMTVAVIMFKKLGISSHNGICCRFLSGTDEIRTIEFVL